jgi:hypothetical protein
MAGVPHRTRINNAWTTPCRESLAQVLHPNALFAYPTTSLNYSASMSDFDLFVRHFTNTTITIPRNGLIIDAETGHVSVHWKFSTYSRSDGVRQAVNDAIVGIVSDGMFVEWLEFLDGRVKVMQAAEVLSSEDGPNGVMTPWPPYLPGKEQCRAVVTVSCP